MTMFDTALEEVVRADSRYAYEAYEFLFQALTHTQQMLDRLPPDEPEEGMEASHQSPFHVSGRELLEGIRDLAQREFGLMARIVFHLWGINSTADFGEMVFNLIEAGLMTRTAEDRREDFYHVYDLDEALVRGFQITLDEVRGL